MAADGRYLTSILVMHRDNKHRAQAKRAIGHKNLPIPFKILFVGGQISLASVTIAQDGQHSPKGHNVTP
jgi:hypothetical protein